MPADGQRSHGVEPINTVITEDSRLRPRLPKETQRYPRHTSQALKLSKRPPNYPQNIPIFWDEDSFNRPGQPRGNITPNSAPPTGFELQLHIIYLKTFRSIYLAPRHPVSLVYNGNCPEIISTKFPAQLPLQIYNLFLKFMS